MKGQTVSIVVCTRNNRENIERVVQSIINEQPYEVIVVDGDSSDGTREVLKKMPVKLITDPGKGLAYARKIALEHVSGDYTLFVGDDNIIQAGSVKRVLDYIQSHDWCGGAYQTRIDNPKECYWANCSNWRWKVRFKEGERKVIGTPYMFETKLLKRASYDENCGDADDADMEKRIRQMTLKPFGYTNQICIEIGRNNFAATKERFRRYGKSDEEYWNKYKDSWTLGRKIKSILHPFRDEFCVGIHGVAPFYMKLYVLPYLLIITFLRYQGWLMNKRKRNSE